MAQIYKSMLIKKVYLLNITIDVYQIGYLTSSNSAVSSRILNPVFGQAGRIANRRASWVPQGVGDTALGSDASRTNSRICAKKHFP
jgi:hypothetical protein